MLLDLTNLEKSLDALAAVLRIVDAPDRMQSLPQDVQEAVQAAVVQDFEVAYEQCWKSMKRWLEIHVAPDAADGVTRRELFRRAAEQQLIVDVDQWMEFHKARNTTAHTYDQSTATAVAQAARKFLPLAHTLAAALATRND